ncbi:MAG: hypothetical protein LBC50_00035 [Candidatus Ancillula sp.]|nr:hypothetical protein [Candidatus Ancillula sp.]
MAIEETLLAIPPNNSMKNISTHTIAEGTKVLSDKATTHTFGNVVDLGEAMKYMCSIKLCDNIKFLTKKSNASWKMTKFSSINLPSRIIIMPSSMKCNHSNKSERNQNE